MYIKGLAKYINFVLDASRKDQFLYYWNHFGKILDEIGCVVSKSF